MFVVAAGENKDFQDPEGGGLREVRGLSRCQTHTGHCALCSVKKSY